MGRPTTCRLGFSPQLQDFFLYREGERAEPAVVFLGRPIPVRRVFLFRGTVPSRSELGEVFPPLQRVFFPTNVVADSEIQVSRVSAALLSEPRKIFWSLASPEMRSLMFLFPSLVIYGIHSSLSCSPLCYYAEHGSPRMVNSYY